MTARTTPAAVRTRRAAARVARRGRTIAACAALAAGLGHTTASATAAIGNLAAARADDGAHVIAELPVDADMVDLQVASPALQGTGMVRLILPRDWSANPTATWPALYMINGSADALTYRSWTAYTDLEAVMAPRDVLTAMPSDGKDGYGSSRLNGGPNYDIWESVEVPQILQRAYRANGHSAIAGLSSGGSAAMELAALHPGEYGAVASYSAPLDSQMPLISQVIEADEIAAGDSPWALWGSPLLNAGTWAAHNPRALVARLKGTTLFVSCGNGLFGPLDNLLDLQTTIGGGLLEAPALLSNLSFLAAAALAGVRVTADLYGPGTHSWPYWQREFGRSWPVLAGALGVPAS